MARNFLCGILVVSFWACDGRIEITPFDGGFMPSDASTTFDSGLELPSDSGTNDAGPFDAGAIDAGSTIDAGNCNGTLQYFREVSYPTVFSRCAGCHSSGGQADGTRFLLRPFSTAAALSANIRSIAGASVLESNSQPLLILKPTGQLAHGGGTLFSPTSSEVATIRRTMAEIRAPIICPGDIFPRANTEGVIALTPLETLHKASMQIAGRVPSENEMALVADAGLPAIDSILTAQMTEPKFEERLREMLSDWILTDAFRANNVGDNQGNIISNIYHHASVNGTWGGPNYDLRGWPNGEGILLAEALGREPVEFAVQAAKNNRPMSEIVTAKYRLLNAYSARFYNVPYKGFAAGTAFSQIPNPGEFVPVASVPFVNENASNGEYAGILTTTAWLNRYPSSPTNFNRKRSRFTLKYFLDFDIMKSAPRIDASAVNLEDTPTVKNMQCTGCHQLLDPIAGMYLNQDECGYDATVFYSPMKYAACGDNGWRPPIDMFPPGTGAGTASAIALAQRPKALEVLGAYIATQRSFAKSMTTMVYTSLLGRSLLIAPRDPSQPTFDAQDLAYDAEVQLLESLTNTFVSGGLKLAPLVHAIVKSGAFRSGSADIAMRGELAGLGGGTLVTPEILNRKIQSTLGIVWGEHGWRTSATTGYQRTGKYDGTMDAYLVQRELFKTLYGGADQTFTGVKARQRGVSSLTAAIMEHMALEVSCIAVTRDFDKPPSGRILFAQTERTQTPTGTMAQDTAVVATIQKLNQRFFGVSVAASSADVVELYNLFIDVRNTGIAAISASQESVNLARPCSSDVNLETGITTTGTGITADANYVIRAWQAVIAALMLDPRFTLER
jgi:hypothetical protein